MANPCSSPSSARPRCLLAVLLALAVVAHAQEASFGEKAPALQRYPISLNYTTVSGLSSGGYQATQFQFAFACDIIGAAAVSSGPFYCSQGNSNTAQMACMRFPAMIDINMCHHAAKTCVDRKECGSLECLARHRNYVYSGTRDATVVPGVTKRMVEEFMPKYFSTDTLLYKDDIPSEHAWITDYYGNACPSKASPYINNCNYDMAFDMLQHLLAPRQLQGPTQPDAAGLVKFDQTPFIEGMTHTQASLFHTGYLYVPKACRPGAAARGGECVLHIHFHGCQQTVPVIGEVYMMNNGVNRVAEANNIVVYYPTAQAVSSWPSPFNPLGCFDFFKVVNENFANNKGVQNRMVKNVIDSIAL